MASDADPSLKGIRDRVLLLYGFASALRRSEPEVWSGNLEETAREREHDVLENIEIILLPRDQV